MPEVKSLNMRIPEMWNRIWASEFLLHKPQYFATHTYLGRLNTPPFAANGILTVVWCRYGFPRVRALRSNTRDIPW